jgi:hypothetical protein
MPKTSLIDRYFDAREFEQELGALPGQYPLPKGRLLLARRDGQALACVALRDLGESVCEMKRMFVPPASSRSMEIHAQNEIRVSAPQQEADGARTAIKEAAKGSLSQMGDQGVDRIGSRLRLRAAVPQPAAYRPSWRCGSCRAIRVCPCAHASRLHAETQSPAVRSRCRH